MKHTKTILAVVLLFALLLCSCGLVPPQAAAGTREAAAETRMTAQAAPAADYSLQPLAASGGQPAPTTVKSDLFRAKFEGSAVAGSGEAVDGVYRFAATKTDGEAWHVKLESNYPTVAGRDYRVTYRFRSDVAGTVKFGDFQEFKIREGENSVTGVLIATSGTSYLDLQLGMLPPFTIDFSEVEVKEYADEVDYEDALTTPVNFEKETIVYERHDQGYAPVLTRSSDQVSINYVAAPWDPGVWRSRLYAKTSLIPAAGTHYRVTADVEGDQDMPFEILFNNGDEEKGYGALYGQNLVAGQVTHCEAVITGTGDGDNLVLQFSLGQAPEGSTVQVSNLRVEKILDHYSSMLPASFALDKVIATGRTIHKAIPVDYKNLPLKDFSYTGTDTVYEGHDDGYVVSMKESGSSATMKIAKAPASDRGVWKVRMYAATGVEMEPGTSYRVRFDLKSARNQGEYEVCFDGNTENAYGALYGRSLTAGGTDSVEYVITPQEDRGPLTIRLQLGKTDTTAGNTFTLSKLSVDAVKAVSTDMGGISYVAGSNVREEHGDGIEQSVSASGSSATLNVSQARSGGGVWSSRLFVQTGVVPEAGQRYRVSATVGSAQAIGDFEVVYDNGGTEDGYKAKRTGLSVAAGGSETVTTDITAPDSGCGELVLRFQLGNSPADNTVTVSNIQVCPITGGNETELPLPGFAYPSGEEGGTENNSFDLEANSGAEAALTGDGSSATATVTKPGDDWHVKLYAKPGLELEAGQTYTISMNVTGADGCTACYKNTATGAEDGFGTEAITSGTVTHTVTPSERGGLEILLKIGSVPANTAVKLSDVRITKATTGFIPMPLSGFGYPSVTPESTVNNSFDLEANSGAQATLRGDGGSATATVTKPGDDWHVKLYAKPGLNLEAGKTYRISMDVSGAAGCTACYKNTATGAEDGFGTETIGSGTVTHTVKPSEGGTLEILLKIGNVPAGTAVTVSNIQIEADTPTAISVMPGGASFDLEANSGAEAALSDEGGSATATVTKPGDDWHVKLYAKPHAQLEAGKTYQISLHVTNAAGCTACFKNLATGNEEGFGSAGIGSADQTITQTVTPDSGGELEILLKIGNVPADTAVTVSGVQVNELTTKLAPASFDLGYPVTIPESTAFASFDLEANSGAEAALTGDGSSATATVTKPGDDWHVKLYAKPGVSLEAGKTYRISLNLSGAAAGTVCYKNTATGAEDGFGTEAIGSGTVTHTVTPTESGGLEILLKIGAFPAGGTITVRDVQIAEYKTTDPDVLPEDFAYPVTTPSSLKKNSFDLEANSGAEAALSGDGSSATATVTKPGDDWHVKFYAKPGLNLEAGKTYRISMDVSGAAGCTACYKNTATGAEDGFGTEAIGSGTVTHTVTPAENGTLEILLKIGNVPAGTAVKVSGLRVCELRDSIGENQMTDSLNAWAPINFWAHEDYAASLSNDEASASLAINNAPASGREPWKVKLFAETGKKLTAGKSYRISVDTSASAALNYEICYNNGAVEKGVGAKYDLTATTSAKTVSYEVTPGSDADLVLQFSLGNSAAGNTFTIRNVKVEELRYETTSHALPSFRYDSVGYISKAADDGYITDLKQNSNSADFRILKAPANDRNPWNVKLNVRTGFTPESNKGYWVSFDIDSARKQDLFEVFYDGNSEATYGALYEQSLPVGKTTYSNIIMPGDSRGELVLQLRLGKTDGTVGNAYTVSNLKIEEVTFEFTKTPEKKDITELWTHSGYLSHLEKTRDKATVRIEKTPASGKEPWRTKLFVDTGVTLKAGEKYRVCMDVKSIIPAPFEVCFNDGDTEKGIGGMFGLLSTPAGRYVEYVTYPKQDAHLVIQLSLGNCAAPNSLMLSGVSVEKAGAINLISDTIYTF